LEAVQGAAAIARASPDGTALAEVALVLEGFDDVTHQAEIVALCEEGLGRLPHDARALRARLLAQTAVHAQLVEASARSRELSEQALSPDAPTAFRLRCVDLGSVDGDVWRGRIAGLPGFSTWFSVEARGLRMIRLLLVGRARR
ncbi:MAG TPA: hypothetical protein VLK79_16805, partial [Gaiellales bacterium]|nr:hypothetical protein [Gaiellales bacterium]